MTGEDLAQSLRSVVEIPRQSDEERESYPDPFGVQRLAAFAAAFHQRSAPLIWGWRRAEWRGPVSLLTSSPSILPPGSVHQPAGDSAAAAFSAPSWVAIEGRHDGLVDTNDDNDSRPGRSRHAARPSLESCLLAVWERLFAVLVIAEPVPLQTAADVVQDAADKTRYAKQRAESNPDRAVEYERLKAWHRELRGAESTGLWRVRLRVGADDAQSAHAVAGLAIASLDLEGTGYTLVPGQPDQQCDEGFLASSRLLAGLTRPPSTEVPGLRLVRPSEFDTTPEIEGGPIVLGHALDRDRRVAGKVTLSLESLNRHAFVCGATGGGKSQTTRHLLEEATGQGIPWLVVEPAKSEYRAMSARLPDHEVIVVRPGQPDLVAAGIDPLRPAEGFPLQTHLDLTRALFLAAFDADEPFPQVLAAALTKAYEQQGWNVALGEPRHPEHRPRYPTLADLQKCARDVVEEIGYGREVEDNIRGFVKVRLGSLRLGTTGRFLEGGHALDVGKLLDSNVVLEIEDVGDDSEKSFLMGAVLIALTEHYRVRERRGELEPGKLRHITVFEEAHRLLRNTKGHTRGQNAAAQAVEMFATLLAEVRTYGEGLVIAEQIPAKLVPDVIKNTAVKIVHRLPAKDDRDAVGATMNLSENQSKYLVTLPPGTAAFFADGMDQPVLARMPDGTRTEHTNPTRPSDASSIVSWEFGRCHADYKVQLLTMSDLARGQRLVEDRPLVRWWGELAVVAHLTGKPLPALDPLRREALIENFGVPGLAVLACAVDEAVAARSELIADTMSPAALAEHIGRVLIGTLIGELSLCTPIEPEWLATPYKREGQARHRIIVEDLAFGTDEPSGLERAAGVVRTRPEWEETVLGLLGELDAHWAKRQLLGWAIGATT